MSFLNYHMMTQSRLADAFFVNLRPFLAHAIGG